MSEAWIIDAVRSPRGGGKQGVGKLSHIHPQRILAQCLNALQEHAGFDPADVEDVIMGNNSGVGDHSMDIARMATLDAGWPTSVPGVTLHRFCGSGQQAVNFALMGVMSGQQELVVGGGVESMSRQPMGSDGSGIVHLDRHWGRSVWPGDEQRRLQVRGAYRHHSGWVALGGGSGHDLWRPTHRARRDLYHFCLGP